MPNSASSDLRDTPTPSSYALACPGSCGMFKASVLGVLGCDVRFAVASEPTRHPGSGSGRSYLTCTPQRLETSRLRSSRALWENCWVPGSQKVSRKVTSWVIRNRWCRTIASSERSPSHSFSKPSRASTVSPNCVTRALPGYSRSTPSSARSLAQLTLPPSETPDPGTVVPSSANASALPCVSGAGLRFAGLGATLLADGSAVAAKGGGVFRDGDGGWLASTCCRATARPPNHAPA